jgi:hypothetical protein
LSSSGKTKWEWKEGTGVNLRGRPYGKVNGNDGRHGFGERTKERNWSANVRKLRGERKREDAMGRAIPNSLSPLPALTYPGGALADNVGKID